MRMLKMIKFFLDKGSMEDIMEKSDILFKI